jgi:hypothetical protein
MIVGQNNSYKSTVPYLEDAALRWIECADLHIT